jgi:hypothetical protein
MKDQEGEDKPEQTPGDKASERESAQLTFLQRREGNGQPTANLLALLNAYLFLVTAVAAVGGLAFYTGHKISAEVIFYLSIALLVLIPALLCGYWFVSIRTAPSRAAELSLIDRITSSRFTQFLGHHVGAMALAQYIVCTCGIEEAIRRFPQHPRFSLATMAFDGVLAIYVAMASLEVRLRKRNIELQQSITSVSKTLIKAGEIVVDLSKRERESRPRLTKSPQQNRKK